MSKFFKYIKKYWTPYLDLTKRIAVAGIVTLSIVTLLLLVYLIGFDVEVQTQGSIHRLLDRIIYLFMLFCAAKYLSEDLAVRRLNRKQLSWRASVVYAMLYLMLLPDIFATAGTPFWESVWALLKHDYYQAVVLVLISILELSDVFVGIMKHETNPSKIFVISFLMVILIGAGMLLLPNSTYGSIGLTDALFISTSAVCVTGLTPLNLTETFTPLGLSVICLLVQIGGLGLMTLTSFFATFFMGNRSIYNQMMLSDIFGSKQFGSLFGTLWRIMGFTAIIEILGFIFIWLHIHGQVGLELHQELGYALFHSISAFCNAGFVIETPLVASPLLLDSNSLLLTVSVLIILGGIGFPILENFLRVVGFYLKNIVKKVLNGNHEMRRSPHLWNLNSKIVLRTTALLLLLGTAGFAVFEWDNLQGTTIDRLVMSFFMSVNPRTSGFGVANISELCMPSLVLVTFLMWIGGASQSTAGGIKVNTIAVAAINLWSVIKERRKVEIFGREINQASVNRANATILMSILVLGVAVFVLTILEPQMELKELFFEAMAALTTVGLGFGVTDQLGMAARIVVIVLMFVGRIGLITLMLGVVKRNEELDFDFPKDDVIIT